MVDGGDNIREASWESVSSMLQVVSNTSDTLMSCGASVDVELNEVCVPVRVEL